VTGEGVQAEGAAEPGRSDAACQDRVVGGMKYAVADPGQGHQRKESEIAGRQSHQGDRAAHGPETDEQKDPGAEAIDQEADRRLAQRGRQILDRQQQAEGGIADTEFRREQRKQRRQDDAVEVREEMAAAHQGDHARVCGTQALRGDAKSAHGQDARKLR